MPVSRADSGRHRRLNIGCGQTPTPGWGNYDNSPTVLLANCLARIPAVGPRLVKYLPLNSMQKAFAEFVLENRITWANAVRRIPVADNSVEVVYSSHMLEHLDTGAAGRFLAEVHRVLEPGGLVRIAVPDLAIQIGHYQEHRDADRFVRDTLLVPLRRGRLMTAMSNLLIGGRHHQWIYDGESLKQLLSNNGFTNADVYAAGQTSISNSGSLDLHERAHESVYVEALKPEV